MTEVLAWLQQHHPQLQRTAEPDRDWLWITADLRGDDNKPARESIKANGFRFARRGHTLPSGRVAFWAHSCTHPIGFKRGGNGKGTAKAGRRTESRTATPAQRPDPLAASPVAAGKDLDELVAAFV